jgi:hypothetical protein
MAKLTPIERLQADIDNILEEYADDVSRKTEECVKKVAQKGALALRRVSPRRSGTYASGWTYKIVKKRLNTEGVIYNSKRPGLAHLLEHGHVTRNGTNRSYDDTPAHVHIAPVEEELITYFQKQIKVDLS